MAENINYYKEITRILMYMGFKCSHLGYCYLREIINIGISGIKILPLNDFGYTYIARSFCKSVDDIDKNIQNSISYAWCHGDIDYIYDFFGITIDEDRGKPTNKQFIMTFIDKIRSM